MSVLAATPDRRCEEDAPPRLVLPELATADVVAAEDTRRLRRAARSGSTGRRVVSYFEGNEQARTGSRRCWPASAC